MLAGPEHRCSRVRIDRWSTGLTWIALAGAALLLTAVDHAFPAVGMGPAYIPLIALAGWRLGLAPACAVALAAAFLNIFPHHADEATSPAVAAARGAMRLGTYTFIVALVCALRRSYDRERTAARRDHLTGAFTRAAFEEQVAALSSPSVSSSGAIALALIDVDGFKGINDTYGHAAGDEALRALVRSAATTMHRNDCVARVGGDEFAVILCAATIEEALSRAAALHGAISDSLALGTVAATASMGVRIFSLGEFNDVASALRGADQLMYAAKAAGPGNWRSEPSTQIRPRTSTAWPNEGLALVQEDLEHSAAGFTINPSLQAFGGAR